MRKQIIEYIESTITIYKPEVIKEKLLEAGYNEAEIDDALAIVITGRKPNDRSPTKPKPEISSTSKWMSFFAYPFCSLTLLSMFVQMDYRFSFFYILAFFVGSFALVRYLKVANPSAHAGVKLAIKFILYGMVILVCLAAIVAGICFESLRSSGL